MLLRSQPYDHILQPSTITCRHNNKLHRIALIFPLYSQLTDFDLTLTLIIISDFLSVPKTRIDSDLFWIVKCEISVVYIIYTCKASKIELHQSTAASTWWCGLQPCLGWVKIAVGLLDGPSYPGHSPTTQTIFRRAAL